MLARLPATRPFASSTIRLLASTTTAPKEPAAKTTAKHKATSTSKSKPAPKATKPKPGPKPKASKPAQKPVLLYKDIKEHLPPRRPMSAFMYFAAEVRAKRTVTTRADAVECLVVAGKAWRALSDSEKEVYRARSAPAQEAYKVQHAVWADKVDPVVLKVINDYRVKHGKFKYRRHSETPRSPNAYLRLLKQIAHELPSSEAPPGTPYISWIAQQASQRWKHMSDSEKAKYQEEFEVGREKRNAEIAARA